MVRKNYKTKKVDSLITIGFVVHNQQRRLPSAVKKLDLILSKSHSFYEILIIDNGSSDSTYSSLRKLQKNYKSLRALVLSKKYHQESAFMAILEHSIGDYVIIMDLVTDPPNVIPRLLAKATAGFDIVTAVSSKRIDTSWLEKTSQAALNKIASKLIGYKISPDAPYFRILSKRVVNSMIRYRSKRRYLTYLNATMGFKRASISYRPKNTTNSPNRFWRALWLMLDVIISNSSIPLKFAALLGSISSFAYLIYVFVIAIVKKDVAEGWITVSVLNSTMFFLLFIILMILSEYIDRIVNETKDQPTYIVADELNSSDLLSQGKRLNVV